MGITPEKLIKILDGEGDWFLLDVRNDIEYEQWKLEVEAITYGTENAGMKAFIDADPENIPEIFQTARVVIECFDQADQKVMIIETVAVLELLTPSNAW